ncbi:MAG: sugar transferase [Flavobacteriaceae bacterium]|nr:sugar transferase [Flavobacteriaceae bacterium]
MKNNRLILNLIERKGVVFIGDLLLIILSLRMFLNNALDEPFRTVKNDIIVYSFGIFLFFFLAYVLDFYNLEKNRIREVISKSIFVTAIFSLVVFLFTMFLFDASYWRGALLIFIFFTPLQILLWRLFFHNIFKLIPTTKKVLHIFDDVKISENAREIINGKEKESFYQVKISFDIHKDNYRPLLEDVFDKIDAIILNVTDYDVIPSKLSKSIVHAIEQGKEVLSYTSFYENVYEALPIQTHTHSFYELLQLKNKRIRFVYRIFSFIVNFLLSLGIGIVFFVCIPFVWFFNLFLNRGPLFYKQKRVGQFGKEFEVYKFRSMVTNAEKDGAKMATKNDARITVFGKFLRKFRVDELPQIVSVMQGNMVFIGPRPERKVFADQLIEITPFYNVRHLVKPGITGWAQVKYKYGENLEDSVKKLEYDLYYIKNRSVTLDLRIIFKTITTVLFSRGQ